MNPTDVIWLLALAWLLFYQSPALVQRIGCWLSAWGEARKFMQKQHKVLYECMLKERGLTRPAKKAEESKGYGD